jgi:hypothetical protein
MSSGNLGRHLRVLLSLILKKHHCIPIEVKSGHRAALQSMWIFLKNHPLSSRGIRFSTYNYSLQHNLHSYPLYAVAGITENKERLIALIEAQVTK